MRQSLSTVGGIALLATTLVGSGCAKRVESDTRPATESIAEYYPLAVGNQWTYRLDKRDDKPVTVEIVKEQDGYFLDNQGGQLTVDAYGLRDPKRYLLRGPLEAGRGWNNVVSVSSTERYQLVQVGFACQAPAGSFPNCVSVEGRNRVDAKTTLVNTMTFAAGVGLVRVDVATEQDGKRVPQTELELVSFKVGSSGAAATPPPAAN
ncbi:hypothetical protein D7Y13_33715 [Corallococcus praedator]|uniref:Lipoprotein n=1 Tax=Corallococcus praedator TaxID=2316724 RepID=A0ABX9QA26_9BACT|nr:MULTISPECIES: hypothetical protein [Corallococcus]RKH24623.1 hypothetical protein D7X75_31610 [Corallococcus sp. CA031C]RKH93975.1 hypothetical protein D7Y13_33715 [Corallococcus praedator]